MKTKTKEKIGFEVAITVLFAFIGAIVVSNIFIWFDMNERLEELEWDVRFHDPDLLLPFDTFDTEVATTTFRFRYIVPIGHLSYPLNL